MNKLKKLHNKFDKVSLLMQSLEDKINYCIKDDNITQAQLDKYENELIDLDHKQYEIQSKIQYCKTRRNQLKCN